MNTPAIRTLQAVGVKAAAAWAHNLGIGTKINEDLSMALGSSCVYPSELTGVYATIARMGKKAKMIYLRRVLDRDGRILEDHSSFYDPWTELADRVAAGYAKLHQVPEQVMAPETAFLMQQLMTEVCKPPGTGGRAAALGKPVAGKTGTAKKLDPSGHYVSRYVASFIGFLPASRPRVVVAVIIDEPRTVYGGVAAAPVFQEVARYAIQRLGIEAAPAVSLPPHAMPVP